VRAAESAVLAPLGVVAVAQGLQKTLDGDPTGNNELYLALQAYIDGPNRVIDPLVFAADDVAPDPIGGDPAKDPRLMGSSAITNFRANVLLAPRDAIREAVAGPLGVDPIDGNELNPGFAAQLNSGGSNVTISQTKKEPNGPLSQIKKSLRAIPGASNETAKKTGGAHRLDSTGGLGSLFKKREKKTESEGPSTS